MLINLFNFENKLDINAFSNNFKIQLDKITDTFIVDREEFKLPNNKDAFVLNTLNHNITTNHKDIINICFFCLDNIKETDLSSFVSFLKSNSINLKYSIIVLWANQKTLENIINLNMASKIFKKAQSVLKDDLFTTKFLDKLINLIRKL